VRPFRAGNDRPVGYTVGVIVPHAEAVTMTPEEWDSSTDRDDMLRFVRGGASESTLRLFACACCRLVWDLLPGPMSRRAVEVAEDFIYGVAGRDDLTAAGLEAAREADPAEESNAAYWATEEDVAVMLANACWCPVMLARRATFSPRYDVAKADAAVDETIAAQCDLLRDLFTPFHRPTFDPAWLAFGDGLVAKLADGIHEERAFDRMPILGDALEDAGCDDSRILSHCREGTRHALGCWVRELIRNQAGK
jgi:hypothetical protein